MPLSRDSLFIISRSVSIVKYFFEVFSISFSERFRRSRRLFYLTMYFLICQQVFSNFFPAYFQTPFYALFPAIPYLDPALIFLLYTISSPLLFGERLQKRKFTLDYPHWIWYYIRCIQYAYAPVAQLDRALDSDSKGRAFEPHRAYQIRRHDESRAFLFYLEDWSPLAAASSSSGRSLRLPISALSFYYDRYYKRRSFPMEREAPFFCFCGKPFAKRVDFLAGGLPYASAEGVAIRKHRSLTASSPSKKL